MRQAFLVLVVLFLRVSPTLNAGRPPLVHIQTDRPSYRLGETIWYRVHTEEAGPLKVRLLDPGGQELSRADLESTARQPASGTFFLPPTLAGGRFVVEARAGGRLGHRVAIDVHDLGLPALDLSLAVLADSHCPGETATATFRALDLEGRPLGGERVEYLATFGPLRIRAQAGVTDADGRAVVRIVIPAEARESGHLSVGVASKKGQDAIARTVAVAAAVASIDAFPEGGTIVEGHPHRLGLLVRDRAGDPVAAEGSIVDDQGRCVGGFRADRWGVAEVVVPYEEGRSYQAMVERPKGAPRGFPLPGATGHDLSIFVDRTHDGIQVQVRGGPQRLHQQLAVSLVAGGREVARGQVTLRAAPVRKDEGAGGPTLRGIAGEVTLNIPGATGIGRVRVRDGDRMFIDRPICLGLVAPVSVALRPRKAGPLLAGKPVELEVLTSSGGRPIAAEVAISVYQGDPGGIPDLAARALIEPQIVEESRLPQDFPALGPSPAEVDDGFLLVYGATRIPPEGLSAAREAEGDRESLRIHPAAIPVGLDDRADSPAKAPPAPGESKMRTVARPTGLDRLLERAPFTSSARQARSAHRVELLAPASAALATPGLGKPSRTPPQNVSVAEGCIDARRGLFWADQVKTDGQGRATIRIKLNDFISEVAWVAEGRAGAAPVSGRGTISPDPGFRSSFKSPDHLHIGDAFDILLETRVSDGAREEIEVDFSASSCLKPTLRTRLEHDPRKDSALHKFSFLAAAPSEDAELRVTARRGMYREVHVRPVKIHDRKVELTRGESGRDAGLQTFSMEVPREAVAGSVRVHGSVSLEDRGDFLGWARGLLRYPTGCFEQFTSQNYVNLVVLEALLESGEDASVLEEAYRLAREGFAKLLQYRDPATAGFSLFPHKEPQVRATVVALRHLAIYNRVLDRLGRPELEGAIGWLEGADRIDALDALDLTLSLHEMGRTWRGSSVAVDLKARTTYEMALQACCLARWPAPRKPEPAARARRREERLAALLESLKGIHDRDPRLADAGVGVMGSRGGQLSVEALSLYALALEGAGHADQGRRLIGEIESLQGRFQGTHSTALAIQAVGRLGPPMGAELLQVEFTAGGGRPERMAALPGRIRPFLFDRSSSARPGEKAAISVDIKSETPRPYRLAMSYLLESPRSSQDAPYRLHQWITPTTEMESSIQIRLRIEPAGPPPASQVVARIALPGGCVVDGEELNKLAGCRTFSFWSLQGGYLDLYWEHGPKEAISLVIPARAEIAGSFAARPSLIYPYYEDGKEAYADPLAIKVINDFGAKVKPDDLLKDPRSQAAKAAAGIRRR